MCQEQKDAALFQRKERAEFKDTLKTEVKSDAAGESAEASSNRPRTPR